VLQEEALNRLSVEDRAKARVIVQSAPTVLCEGTRDARCDFVAAGHLRGEKHPLTLMGAARLLQGDNTRIVHIGDALDPALGDEARRTMDECPNYLWLGGLAQPEARRRIACARALIHMSRLEGGANVVIEAVRSRVPVLASKIDGNIGLLGHDYEGYFAAGEPLQLAQLMRRMLGEPAFANRLKLQCGLREPLFAPSVEAAAVLALWSDMESFCTGD
jgi:glycosyltransferase involved in cell wall biosynthesis